MSIESQIYLQFILTAVTAVGASFFTAKFALGRFYTQRWWEKKAEAYSAILEALHFIKRDFGEHLDAEEVHREVPEGRKVELRKKSREANDELKKLIDIGQFVLSDKAVAELSDFQKTYENWGDCPNWLEFLDGVWVATNDTLKRMHTIAKNDLKDG